MHSVTVHNPATGALLAELPEATKADVDAAVARARAAQPAWAALGPRARAEALGRVQEALLMARQEIADIVVAETGKPLVEALGSDVLSALDSLKWCATKAASHLEPEKIRLSNPLFVGRKSVIEREPLGVVGIISPWNYPLAIPAGNVAQCLVAGNAVVLKPASFTPQTALKLREIYTRAGIPADVFQVVVGGGRTTGEALIAADIDHLIFTGSVPVGLDVDKRLRERGVGSTMELGGSDAAIVLDDAHFENAVRGVVWARFTNAGQTCAATKRVFVQRSLYDRFVAAVVERTRALRLGSPTDTNTDVGCLTDPRSVDEMASFVDDARKRGGRVLCGGKARPDLGRHFFEPTIIVDLPADARLLTEECFGPILPIVPFDSVDDAIRMANSARFGLCGSVWTSDKDVGATIARRLHTGTVTINDTLYTFAASETPWGGVKDSGHGLTHGRWGLEEVTRIKHINSTPAQVPGPWWFPYGPGLRDTYYRGAQFLYGSMSDKAKTGAGITSNLLRRLRGK